MAVSPGSDYREPVLVEPILRLHGLLLLLMACNDAPRHRGLGPRIGGRHRHVGLGDGDVPDELLRGVCIVFFNRLRRERSFIWCP